ncbi:MAG: hypothetical protein AAF557_21835 [Pseudomonadota bacterium]
MNDQSRFEALFGNIPYLDKYGNPSWSRNQSWWSLGGQLPADVHQHEKSLSADRWSHILGIQRVVSYDDLDRRIASSLRFLQSQPKSSKYLDVSVLSRQTSLLEQLAEHRGSEPTAKWLSNITSIVDEVGTDIVCEALASWADAVISRDLSWVNWQDAQEYQDLNFILDRIEIGALGNQRNLNPVAADVLLADKILVQRAALFLVGENPRHVDANFSIPPANADDVMRTLANTLERNLDRRIDKDLVNETVGAIWLMSSFPQMIAKLEKLGMHMFYPVTELRGGPRSRKCGNAVFWSLNEIGTEDANNAKARIERHLAHDKNRKG